MTLQVKVDANDMLKKVGRLAKLDPRAFAELKAKVAKGVAGVYRNEVRRTYRQGVPSHPALHDFTMDQKGSARKLVDDGELWRSVEVYPVPGRRAEFFIGTAPGPEGLKAEINELGAAIKVTPKMRRFLAAQGLILRKDTVALVIPPRPVYPVALEESLPKLEAIMLQILQDEVSRRITREQVAPAFVNLATRLRNRVG